MEDRRTQHVQTLVVPIFFFLSAYTVTLIREDFFSSRDDNGVVHPSHFFVLHYTHQLCHSRKMQKVISTLLKVVVPYLKQDDLRFPVQPKKMYDIPQGGEYVPAVYVCTYGFNDGSTLSSIEQRPVIYIHLAKGQELLFAQKLHSG